MNANEIARLAVKIAGIGIWVIALDLIADYIPMLGSLPFKGEGVQIGYLIVGGPILLSATGAFLFFGGGAVARFIAKGAVSGVEQPDKLAERQAIAFSIVGLWILSRFSIEVMSAVMLFSINSVFGSSDGSEIVKLQFVTVPLLAKFALGVWLFMGSAGVVRLFRRFQSMGLQKTDASSAVDPKAQISGWQAICFSIVGLLVLMKAFSGAISLAGLFSVFSNSGFEPSRLPQLIEPLVGCVLYLLFGVFLFVRAQRIANWWVGLRTVTSQP